MIPDGPRHRPDRGEPDEASSRPGSRDSFPPRLDSDEVLRTFGAGLIAEARLHLAKDPSARVAGLITLPDSHDAVLVRAMLAPLSGDAPVAGLLVGLVPRSHVASLLAANGGDPSWHEQGWCAQHVLPVVVSTRDGFRFAMLPL